MVGSLEAHAGLVLGMSLQRRRTADRLRSIQPGDVISINIPEGRLEVKVSEEELARRRQNWKPLKRDIPEGWLRRYAAMATSASTGAILKLP
jgi:dihydroxy-acid dehydratase